MPLDMNPAESALVKHLQERVTSIPDDVNEEMTRASGQRAYFKDCMMRANDDKVKSVTTNYVYRYITAMVNDVLATDPTCTMRMRDKMWGPGGVPPDIMAFGDTMERLANFMADTGDFASAAKEWATDAHTVPVGFLKLIWTEDFHRDPIGATLTGPQRTNSLYQRLYREFKNEDFDEESEQYLQLAELSESLRPIALDQINSMIQARGGVEEGDPLVDIARKVQGGKLINPEYLPTVPVFQKFEFDVLDFEDVRWDWKVESPRGWFGMDWIAHRVRMSREQLVEKFNLDDEQAAAVKRTEEDGEGDETYEFREDVDDNESESTVDVWEMQDATTGRVYVFSDEYPALLDEYEPEVTWSKFFTVFPLIFNPTPDGLIGISDVDMLRPLQNEINETRTTKRRGLKAKLPRHFVPAHLANDASFDSIGDAEPFTFNKIPLNTEEFQKNVLTVQADGLDLGWFDNTISNALVELQTMGGRPLSALGAAQKGVSATQTAFTSNQLGEMVSARRVEMQRAMVQVFTAMLEMLLQTMDEATVKSIVGPAAVWPSEARESMFMQMNTEVTADLDSEPDSQLFFNKLSIFMQVAQSMGLMPDPAILADIAKEHLGIDVPIQKWFAVPQQMQNAGPAGTPGRNEGAPPNAPQQQPMGSLPGNAQTVQGIANNAMP